MAEEKTKVQNEKKENEWSTTKKVVVTSVIVAGVAGAAYLGYKYRAPIMSFFKGDKKVNGLEQATIKTDSPLAEQPAWKHRHFHNFRREGGQA